MSEIDISHLASTFSVPQTTFETLLDAPTVALVQTLLQSLETFARSYDDLKAEKLKSDVELEAAVRSGDAKVRQLKESVDTSLKEVESLRRSLNESENARNSLTSELQQLKSSTSSSSSQLQTLQSRIETLEASNRDKLALLDTKSSAYDELSKELTTQQQKIIELRREISELEQKLQKAENLSMTAKFKEQSLQQEVEHLKNNNVWHEDELKRRTAEHSKSRKEKAAQISELQRQYEDASSSVESLKRTETALRSRIDESVRKIEDLHTKVHSLQDDATKSQESFAIDIGNSQRLAQLQEQRANTAQARLRELEEEKERLREDVADEVGQLQAELDSEKTEKEALEDKISNLESHIEALEAERQPTAPTTPRRGLNGSAVGVTPLRGASPSLFATPGPQRLKGSISVTQLYSENSQLKQDVAIERRRNERLKATVDEMINDLEKHQPEFEEIRLDRERLTVNLDELSSLLDETKKDRDIARKESRSAQGKAQGLVQESELLRQQLRDLSTQIQILLLEAQARELGLENLQPMDQAILDRAIRGEIDVSELEGMTDTGRLISERLTVFRNVEQMQEQNTKLLNLTRKLGEEMEGEEAMAKKNQHQQELEELEDLRDRVTKHQDEIKSLTVRAESYVRERDMLRRMLTHRGQLPPDADLQSMFGESVNQPAASASALGTSQMRASTSDDTVQFSRMLKEMQSQYDAYRNESATDQAALREQLNATIREKSEVQSELARASSQNTLAQERYEMLHSNFNMIKQENGELQKRSSALAEVTAKLDIRTQQAAEELVESQLMANSLRNENANLKAERELWKKIEDRLGEDHRQLLEERSRLNKMISDLQSLQNERELQDSESRRRLQTRSDELESELQNVKRRLEDEIDKSEKASQRREYDQEQSRTRIEDLLKGLSNTREDLVAAKTQRDQLQARVDELKIELRNAEEKTMVLQPLLTSRPGAQNDENRLNAEQELAIQVSDLKRDLDLAKNDLLQANEHIEQYKAISQAAEEELQTLNDTHDQYRDETDKALAEKDSKISDLEKRVEDIMSELSSTNNELFELRSKQDESNSRFNDQKAILESDINRLRDENDRLGEQSKLHQADLKAQAEIAQSAQQSYEDELLKHAEAAKLLQTIRNEYNQLKTEVAGYKAEAEAAKGSLHENEETWTETRNKYERELTDLRNRREDVIAQNRRLHEQFESVSAQIGAMKQSHSAPGIVTDDASSNREEIITWLKNEKDILEVQLDVQIQESKRYKQKLERTENQLDETNEKLNKERQSQIDQNQSAMSHTKLMETIQQLNVFRESNASLRNEARQAEAKLVDKTKLFEELTTQLEPLKLRLGEVENQLETKEGEYKILQEDRDRWQKRTQDILQKYDRVDPAEMEALNNQIASLTAEKEQLVKEKQALQTQVDGIDAQIKEQTEKLTEEWETRRLKLVSQAKEKAREQGAAIREKTTQVETLQKELEESKQQLEVTKQELEEAKASVGTAAAPTSAPVTIQDIQQPQPSNDDSELIAERNLRTALETEVQELKNRVQELEAQVASLQNDLNAAQAEKESLQNLSGGEVGDELSNLRIELANVKAELEAKSNEATITTTVGADSVPADQVEAQVAARRAELEKEFEQRTQAAEQLSKDRTERMKQSLNAKLKELRQKDQEELSSKHQEELQKLKDSLANQGERVAANPDAPAGENVDILNVQISEDTAKELVAKNSTIQAIIKRNIINTAKSREEALHKEYEQKMQDATTAAKTAQDNAVTLAEKRQNVKLSMAERKFQTASTKLEVVEKASNETPQRPVAEVWAIAKVAKAQVTTPAAQAATTTAAPAVNAPAAIATNTPAPAKPVQSEPAATASQIKPVSGVPTAKPTIQAPTIQPPATAATTAPSQLPAKPAGRGTGIPRGGRGGSGIPRGGGIGGRGRGLPQPRGGAGNAGAGRGAGAANATAAGANQQQQGQVPNPSSPMNPNAKQFLPGNKRSHDEGPGGQAGNAEKRVKNEG